MTRTPTAPDLDLGTVSRLARRGSYLEQLLADRSCTPTQAPPQMLVAPDTENDETRHATATAERAPVSGTCDGLRPAEVAAVAAAVALTSVRERGASDHGKGHEPTAARTTDCVTACARTALDPTSPEPMSWADFGTVIPVLAGSAGAGASVLAVVLADALAAEGHRVLLVDAADPLRSGLSMVAATDGPCRPGPHPAVSIRQSRRGPMHVARLVYDRVPVRSMSMVPSPDFFAPLTGDTTAGVDVTVVDIGWDAWALAALPLLGPGAWLRIGAPSPRPVLALRPTAPGVRAVEQLLERLSPWCAGGGATPVAGVAIMGSRKAPTAVTAAAGMYLTPLLDTAAAVPSDRVVGELGITAAPTPAHLQQAVAPLLAAWGLLATAPPSASRSGGVTSRLLRRTRRPQEGTSR